MKEEIEAILKDESYTDEKERVNAIAKVIPLYTVPKKKYNDLSERLQNVENEKSTTEEKLKEIQKQNMTAEELQQEKEKELAEREQKIIRRENESIVESMLSKNNITSETYGSNEYENLVASLIGADEETSKNKTTNFLNILAKQKEYVEKETTTSLLNNTPKPQMGGQDDHSTTTLETYKTLLAEASKNGDMTKMAYYTRVVQELEKVDE